LVTKLPKWLTPMALGHGKVLAAPKALPSLITLLHDH